ncbi:MAG: DUF6967 family protein [Burkholderiales bacterium]
MFDIDPVTAKQWANAMQTWANSVDAK